MNTALRTGDFAEVLPRFGAAIDAELATWSSYLSSIEDLPTYGQLLSKEDQAHVNSIAALTHLLCTLPARHVVLASSYNDMMLDPIPLPEACVDLLYQLHADAICSDYKSHPPAEGLENFPLSHQSPSDVASAFDKILSSKKLTAAMLEFERELHELEQERLRSLKSLKASQLAMTEVQASGELEAQLFVKFVDAMESVGVLIGDLEFVIEDSDDDSDS